jgi:hypothetical protein
VVTPFMARALPSRSRARADSASKNLFQDLLGLSLQITPKTVLHFGQEVLEMLRDRCYFRQGECKAPFVSRFSL